jgi:nicotinic acid phosphoribosyltransferase
MVNLNKEILDCLNKKGYSWAKIVYSEELVIKVAIEEVSKFVRRRLTKPC